MKKAITLILAALLAAQFVSCGSETVDDSETTEGVETTRIDSESDTTALKAPDLPKVDMGENEFSIITQGWASYAPLDVTDVCVTEQNGEILNDTAFKRKSAVEEKYNCKLTEVYDPTGGNDAISMINASVMAGDNSYALAMIRSRHFNSLITNGSLTDLSNVPNLDLESDYYMDESYDALSIDGTHYGIVSNLSTNPYLLIFCSYFNKVMLDEYKFDDMYEVVRSGKWTIDKMYEMSKLVAADVNSDGKFNSEDRYGTTYIVDVTEGLINSSDVKLAVSKDGKIEKSYKSQTAVDKMQHIFDILSDESVTFNVHARASDAKETNRLETGMFIERQTLFSLAGIYYAPQFRDMKDDFGIIPLPKYDEAQEDYISPLLANVFPITVIPRSNDNLDWTGIILEEMSYRGYTELLPALYDTVLTGKCVRDDDSVEMLDIIFSNTSYDIGMIFDFGGVRTEIRNILHTLNGNFSSTFASIDSKVDANIDELIKAVDENK